MPRGSTAVCDHHLQDKFQHGPFKKDVTATNLLTGDGQANEFHNIASQRCSFHSKEQRQQHNYLPLKLQIGCTFFGSVGTIDEVKWYLHSKKRGSSTNTRPSNVIGSSPYCECQSDESGSNLVESRGRINLASKTRPEGLVGIPLVSILSLSSSLDLR